MDGVQHAKITGDGATESRPRHIARPLNDRAVHVVMGMNGRPRGGPWSVVTDVPDAQGEMVGPPPGYLALAGWAT